MNHKSLFAATVFGAALVWSLAGRAVLGVAAEKQAAKDPQLAQLHMRLRGVSG